MLCCILFLDRVSLCGVGWAATHRYLPLPPSKATMLSLVLVLRRQGLTQLRLSLNYAANDDLEFLILWYLPLKY